MNPIYIKVIGISINLIFLSFYFFFNRRIKEARLLHTRLDELIPFVAIMVIPYLFFYVPLLYGSIFISYFQSLTDFYIFTFSLLLVLFESFFIFVAFPTRVKEHEPVGDSIWHRLVKLIYKHDMRVTAFPSIHVGVSIVCSYYLALWFEQATILLMGITVSIIISTVTLKQHSILDIIGGLATGITAIILGNVVFTSVERFLLI